MTNVTPERLRELIEGMFQLTDWQKDCVTALRELESARTKLAGVQELVATRRCDRYRFPFDCKSRNLHGEWCSSCAIHAMLAQSQSAGEKP